MAPRSVHFHPQAADEAQRAYDWYFERNPSAAQAFSADLEHAINRVSNAPERWPFYHGPARRYVFQPTFRTSRCNHLILFVSISFDQSEKSQKIPQVRPEVRNVGFSAFPSV